MSAKPKKQKKAREEEKGLAHPQQAPVVHNNSFPLSDYIKQYEGPTRHRRLLYIAQRCPELQRSAFRQAIQEIKEGKDAQAFLDAVSMAREALGEDLGSKWGLDNAWLDQTKRSNHEKQVRLEAALAEAKRIGEREPIRQALVRLAKHHQSTGEYTTALAKFLETKEFVSHNQQTLETCFAIIRVSIAMGSMSYVKNQAQRAQTIPDLGDDEGQQASLQAAIGLHNLKTGNYSGAASSFLSTRTALGCSFRDVLTMKDISVYGSICALASYSRKDLKGVVENNATFRKYLELSPEWEKIIRDFHTCKFAACFASLKALEPTVLLDMYLAPHWDALLLRVRNKAVVQYFRPFISVKLPSMAVAFGTDVPGLEKILVGLIADKKISARIDSHNKVLYARHADARYDTFQQTLGMGEQYIRDVKALLLRMSLVQHNFSVKAPPRKRGGEADEEDEDMTGAVN